MQYGNRSEVSRLKSEFEMQNAAAQYALYGLSQGSAKHKIINRKMERMGELQDSLQCLIGERRTAQFIVRTMDHGMH